MIEILMITALLQLVTEAARAWREYMQWVLRPNCI